MFPIFDFARAHGSSQFLSVGLCFGMAVSLHAAQPPSTGKPNPGAQSGVLAVLLPAVPLPFASEPNVFSERNIFEQLQIQAPVEVEVIRAGIRQLMPAMTCAEVRRVLSLDRLKCEVIAGSMETFHSWYRVDAQHNLSLSKRWGNDDKLEFLAATLSRGSVVIASFTTRK